MYLLYHQPPPPVWWWLQVLSTREQVELFSRLPALLANSSAPVLMHRWLWRAVCTAGPFTVQPDGFIAGWYEEVYRKVPITTMRCLGSVGLQRAGVSPADWRTLTRLVGMKSRRECKGEIKKMERLDATSPFHHH